LAALVAEAEGCSEEAISGAVQFTLSSAGTAATSDSVHAKTDKNKSAELEER
jgi:hypothetical protein